MSNSAIIVSAVVSFMVTAILGKWFIHHLNNVC